MLEQLEMRLTPAGNTVYWTGFDYLTGGAGNANWSDPANWYGGVAPTNGDNVVFDNTALYNSSVDDIANLSVANLTVTSDYGGQLQLAANLTATGNVSIGSGKIGPAQGGGTNTFSVPNASSIITLSVGASVW